MPIYNAKRRENSTKKKLAKAEAWRNEPFTKPCEWMTAFATNYFEELKEKGYRTTNGLKPNASAMSKALRFLQGKYRTKW